MSDAGRLVSSIQPQHVLRLTNLKMAIIKLDTVVISTITVAGSIDHIC